MIGGINSELDVDVFLTKEEIERLNSQTLEGTIINLVDPKIHKPFKLNINEKKSNFKIAVKIGDVYQVFLSSYYYDSLKKIGHIGTRYGFYKVDILEESCAENDDDFRFELKYLKSLKRNKEKLRE